MGEVV